MASCDVCGNEYDKTFQVIKNDKTYTFDSFECAIHKLAPKCTHCNCQIVGHGMEKDNKFFCCKNCADKSDVTGFKDRL